MTATFVEIGKWVDEIEVRLVDDLPAACGGAVAHLDDEGTRWVLLEPWSEWRYPDGDLDEWAAWSAGEVEETGWVTAPRVAEHFGVTTEEARGGFWMCAIEWWSQRCG